MNESIQDQGGLSVLRETVVRWLPLVEQLESISHSYKQIKKVLMERKKSLVLDKSLISQIIPLLKPFKHVIIIIQKGIAPSLHLVTIAVMTLRETLRDYTSLMDYVKSYGINSSAEDVSEEEEEYVEEDEGNYYQNM